MISRRVLLAIGVLTLSGASCMGASWLCGLPDAARIELFGRVLAAWFCCGPFAGVAVGWYLNQRVRQGWRRPLSEEL